MKKSSAKEAKDEVGRLIDTALQEPVEGQKKGRPVAVLLSLNEYKRFQAHEDAFWARKADKASKEGFIGVDASEKFLTSLLNAKER